LERPRAADAAAAAADEAGDEGPGDPSVTDIVDHPPPRSSASPTPPPAPACQARLRDVIAARDARGEEPPGLADEDHLVEGQKESDVEDNLQAVARQEERSAREAAGRKKTGKSDPAIEADSDASLEAPRPAKKKDAKKDAKSRKRARSSSSSDSSDSEEHRSGTSRHRPVTNSAIYNTYVSEGQILSDIRKRFQTIVFARDGSAPKTLTVHRALNFKAALLAAKDVMNAKMYRDFKNAMENAYKDTSKE
jgi:hypothetical protein